MRIAHVLFVVLGLYNAGCERALELPDPGGLPPSSGTTEPAGAIAPTRCPGDPLGAICDIYTLGTCPEGAIATVIDCRPVCQDPSTCDELAPLPAACENYVPGCGDPALPAPGCYVACRSDRDCLSAESCRDVVVNPCAGLLCEACGAHVQLCIPR